MTGAALVVQGDALRLPLPDASVDAICTDPPYGLEFMGKDWDAPWRIAGLDPRPEQRFAHTSGAGGPNGRPYEGKPRWSARTSTSTTQARLAIEARAYQAWCQQWASEALRVLKPGGWMLAFGGTRTWHRLTCGIEDAGFELRDQTAEFSPSYGPLAWVHAQGFPKGKACLKPAWEPVVVARRPGSSVLQIDAGRIGHASAADLAASQAKNPGRADLVTSDVYGADRPQQRVNGAGRWPSNVAFIHDEGCQPIGVRKVRGTSGGQATPKRNGAIYAQDDYTQARMVRSTIGHADPDGTETIEAWACVEGCPVALLDQQSGERPSGGSPAGSSLNTGLRGNTFTRQRVPLDADRGGASRFFYTAKADRNERVTIDGDSHPTVKPLDLVRWLVRLVTPPGGIVLDMFGGSGTTGEAAMLEGFTAIVVDKDPASCAKAKVRAHPYVRRRQVVTGPLAGPEQGVLL